MNMQKVEDLKFRLLNLDNLVVAFSGGVDSSFLIKIASEVLGKNAMAITIKTDYMSNREINEATLFADKHNINHKIITIETIDNIKNNPDDRCYLCKKQLFSTLIEVSSNLGFKNIADGTNKDDLNEYRPGIRAANELKILSPLKNFTKSEIRKFSKILNLETFDKPSYPCLLTRLSHNYKFNKNDLVLIEKIENLLIQNGYNDIRARFDGSNIKIEMPYSKMVLFINDKNFKNIINSINKNLKNGQITLDLKGKREEVIF